MKKQKIGTVALLEIRGPNKDTKMVVKRPPGIIQMNLQELAVKNSTFSTFGCML
jgi:hypothetical protein